MSIANSPPKKQSRTLVGWLAHKRIAISLVFFTMLIGHDVLTGNRPRDITNYRELSSMLAIALVVAGLAIRSWAAGILKKGAVLATTGPYRMVRHPLYVGSFLMMVGFTMLIGDWCNLIIIVGPVALLYWLTIHGEESRLAHKFGESWHRFARTTPRFIPRTLSCDFSDWRVSQWMSSREYQAVIGSVIAFAAIKLWQLY